MATYAENTVPVSKPWGVNAGYAKEDSDPYIMTNRAMQNIPSHS